MEPRSSHDLGTIGNILLARCIRLILPMSHHHRSRPYDNRKSVSVYVELEKGFDNLSPPLYHSKNYGRNAERALRSVVGML